MEIYICSSHGQGSSSVAFKIDEHGGLLQVTLADTWEEPLPERFDTAEFIACYGKLDEWIDILDIGYMDVTGRYTPPELDFRKHAAEVLRQRQAEAAEQAAAKLAEDGRSASLEQLVRDAVAAKLACWAAEMAIEEFLGGTLVDLPEAIEHFTVLGLSAQTCDVAPLVKTICNMTKGGT